VSDRRDARIVDEAQIDGHQVRVARLRARRLHPRPIHRVVHFARRRERIGLIDPLVLMLAREHRGQEQPTLARQELRRHARTPVHAGVPPEDAVLTPHGRGHAASGAPSANCLMRQSGPDWRAPTVLVTTVSGSSTEACAASRLEKSPA
jgi:hypothetical protein